MSAEGLNLFNDFFAHATEEVADSVRRLRTVLQEYSNAKRVESEAAARKKVAKEEIGDLFGVLPDEYKATIAMTPKDVAGQTIAREKKVITIDGWDIIVSDKVNTSFEREKFFKWLDGEISAATGERRSALQDVKNQVNRMLEPKKSTELNIEPVKESTR